jgi:hypothetical protein
MIESPEIRRVDCWPTVVHSCQSSATGETTMHSVTFRGACRDGVTVDCPRCGVRFAYVKPKVKPGGGPSAAQDRMHF